MWAGLELEDERSRTVAIDSLSDLCEEAATTT
jgi:hypothetical protein